MNVFECMDYKKYLEGLCAKHRHQHGYKSRLAEAAGCQKSFFSKVLKGPTHLTAEHAAGLTAYWRLPEEEAEYFVELVNWARAGTPALRKHVAAQLEKLRRDRDNLARRFQEAATLSDEQAGVYYSGWQFLAVHYLLSIPRFQNVEAISRRLECSEATVAKTLGALREMNLVETDGGRWKMNGRSYHLPRESPLTQTNHANWRMRAIQNSFERNARDIHYTSVGSISLADVEKIRQLTLDYLDKGRAAMAESGTEELFCMTCDFFRV